jgi:membrane protein implicated in regulation of membrane protease activity
MSFLFILLASIVVYIGQIIANAFMFLVFIAVCAVLVGVFNLVSKVFRS